MMTGGDDLTDFITPTINDSIIFSMKGLMDEETRRKIREAVRCLGYSHGAYVLEVTGLLAKWVKISGSGSGLRFFEEYEKSPEKVKKEIKRFDITFPPNDDSAKN